MVDASPWKRSNAPPIRTDRATEDSRHPGVEGGLPEDLVVRGLNLHEVDPTGNDREGKLQKMPQRHQGAPQNATDATAKHCAITPIFCHVLLWRPRCVEWNEFKFEAKWRSHQVHHERRNAALGWRHWADQHDNRFTRGAVARKTMPWSAYSVVTARRFARRAHRSPCRCAPGGRSAARACRRYPDTTIPSVCRP